MSKFIDADKVIAKLQDEYHGMLSDESMKIYKIIRLLNEQPSFKIGDTAYGIRRFHGVPKIQEGKISEMYYLLSDMSLQVVIKYVCRGKIGENIFLTREEAEKALKEREENARDMETYKGI